VLTVAIAVNKVTAEILAVVTCAVPLAEIVLHVNIHFRAASCEDIVTDNDGYHLVLLCVMIAFIVFAALAFLVCLTLFVAYDYP